MRCPDGTLSVECALLYISLIFDAFEKIYTLDLFKRKHFEVSAIANMMLMLPCLNPRDPVG